MMNDQAIPHLIHFRFIIFFSTVIREYWRWLKILYAWDEAVGLPL